MGTFIWINVQRSQPHLSILPPSLGTGADLPGGFGVSLWRRRAGCRLSRDTSLLREPEIHSGLPASTRTAKTRAPRSHDPPFLDDRWSVRWAGHVWRAFFFNILIFSWFPSLNYMYPTERHLFACRNAALMSETRQEASPGHRAVQTKRGEARARAAPPPPPLPPPPPSRGFGFGVKCQLSGVLSADGTSI